MKAYLQFGDWSEDGHGKYHNLLVEINNMRELLQAQKQIKNIYGKNFFSDFAFYEVLRLFVKTFFKNFGVKHGKHRFFYFGDQSSPC